jgi:L-amino acid N-acyltransferase YncA
MLVREATVGDAAAVHEIYAPVVRETTISFEIEPPSVEEMGTRIAAALTDWTWLVAEERGEVLGYAYSSKHRDRAAYSTSVDLAVYVAPSAQRRGVARTLYGELFPRLAAQGRHMAFAGIALPNDPSVKLHQSLGFTHVGIYREVGFKFGAFHDTSWWQRRL